jgi:hypothetical protein
MADQPVQTDNGAVAAVQVRLHQVDADVQAHHADTHIVNRLDGQPATGRIDLTGLMEMKAGKTWG